MIYVENMTGSSGHKVVNQFKIRTNNGSYLQSYGAAIVYKDNYGNITLGKGWDYGPTTGRYRNLFLRENKEITLSKINQGIYKIINLEITDD